MRPRIFTRGPNENTESKLNKSMKRSTEFGKVF